MKTLIDACTLRDRFSVRASSDSRVVIVKKHVPGTHGTQLGHFDVELGHMSIRICVWKGGVVELHSMSATGVTHEIETIRDCSLQSADDAIWKHIERNA